jgi:hypothetical protein
MKAIMHTLAIWNMLKPMPQKYFLQGCKLGLWIGGVIVAIVWTIMYHIFN